MNPNRIGLVDVFCTCACLAIVTSCTLQLWEQQTTAHSTPEQASNNTPGEGLELDLNLLFPQGTEESLNQRDLPTHLTTLLDNAAANRVAVNVCIYCESTEDLETINKGLVLCALVRKYTQHTKMIVDCTHPELGGKLRVYTTTLDALDSDYPVQV